MFCFIALAGQTVASVARTSDGGWEFRLHDGKARAQDDGGAVPASAIAAINHDDTKRTITFTFAPDYFAGKCCACCISKKETFSFVEYERFVRGGHSTVVAGAV